MSYSTEQQTVSCCNGSGVMVEIALASSRRVGRVVPGSVMGGGQAVEWIGLTVLGFATDD